MIANRRRFLLFLILTLLFMGLIFYKSSQSYQEQDLKPFLTDYISEETIRQLVPEIEFTYDNDLLTYKEPVVLFEFFIRKAAHVTEYFVLTLLIGQTLRSTYMRPVGAWLLAGLLSILYACSDEWHQSFVPNRTGHAIDVYTFDLYGVLLCLVIALIALYTRGRSRSRRKPPRYF